MPKSPTFEPTFNELISFDIADLKRHGFMVGGYCCRPLTWPRRGVSIRLRVNFLDKVVLDNYVELEYTYRGEPVCYRVELVQVASNLGKGGKVWYFVCPSTGRRCRKLYDGGKYFVSRYALKGWLYASQTYSKAYRSLETMYGPGLKLDDLRQEVERPYVKHHYKGKLTKRMQKYYSLSQVVDTRRQAGYRSVDDLIKFL